MLTKLLYQILVAILGLFLAIRFIPGVIFSGPLIMFFFCCLILGIINSFIKPVLNLLALPLRIFTLGFFGILINMGILWFLDILFYELEIKGILPLFYTTCIISILSLFLKP